jgi:hypothetical protein
MIRGLLDLQSFDTSHKLALISLLIQVTYLISIIKEIAIKVEEM